jgi:hypothetical protein
VTLKSSVRRITSPGKGRCFLALAARLMAVHGPRSCTLDASSIMLPEERAGREAVADTQSTAAAQTRYPTPPYPWTYPQTTLSCAQYSWGLRRCDQEQQAG